MAGTSSTVSTNSRHPHTTGSPGRRTSQIAVNSDGGIVEGPTSGQLHMLATGHVRHFAGPAVRTSDGPHVSPSEVSAVRVSNGRTTEVRRIPLLGHPTRPSAEMRAIRTVNRHTVGRDLAQ